MEQGVPLSKDEVTASYLTRVLRRSGWLSEGEVSSVGKTLIGDGAGFMGDVVDLRLEYSPGSVAESGHCVLKIPTASGNRKIGESLGVYEREIRFYLEFGDQFPIRIPRLVYGTMSGNTDPKRGIRMLSLLDRLPLWMVRLLLPLSQMRKRDGTTARYLLLIEHLGTLRGGDQVAGCSPSDAKRVVESMARMHACFWQSPVLETLPWLVPVRLTRKLFHVLFLKSVEPFKARRGGMLSPGALYWLNWLGQNYFDMIDWVCSGPQTLLHGDFRLDNLAFDDEKNEIVLFDWQTVGIGNAGVDLGYFLSASLDQLTTPLLDEMLEAYRQTLHQSGVSVSLEQLRHDFGAGVLMMFHRIVSADFQDLLDLGEGRGQDLVTTWIGRMSVLLDLIELDIRQPRQRLESPS